MELTKISQGSKMEFAEINYGSGVEFATFKIKQFMDGIRQTQK
jgi:hypothetical protein